MSCVGDGVECTLYPVWVMVWSVHCVLCGFVCCILALRVHTLHGDAT